MAVADSVEASFDRGVMDIEGLLPWFAELVSSPLRQLAVAPMRPLRFHNRGRCATRASPSGHGLRGQALPQTLPAARLAVTRWRFERHEASSRSRHSIHGHGRSQPEARARVRLASAETTSAIDPRPIRASSTPQLAGLVLATAVQEGDEGLFDHLLGLLESSSDATSRSRILSALGHAETPELSARALDLALDPRLRVNEIRHVLRTQFHNPRTRDRAWKWFTGELR